MRTALLTGLILLFGATGAHAIDQGIVTDRPDFVESSDVVGEGRFQIETSLAWEKTRRDGVTTRTRSTPTLLRLGINDSWELRLETDGRLVQRSSGPDGDSRQQGWADTALGLKWHQRDSDDETCSPGLGWLFHVDMNSGSSAFRGQGLRPSVRFVAEWDLPDAISLGVMPGLFIERNDQGQRYTGALFAVVVGKSFGERLHGFVEFSAQQLARQRDGGHVMTLDLGLAYLLSRDVQLDIATSRGLTRNTPDSLWTVGLSVRF